MRHCETCTGASALSAHESSNTIIPRTAGASGAHEKGKIPPGKKLRAPQERNRTRGACARAGERGAAMLAAILAGASPARGTCPVATGAIYGGEHGEPFTG